ncbi:tetraacyldisaccharide 4'-kinase [bacterium]|jgi:tetraacyldisaccharide 4'-kinase|nr:tetraacyldisaccharide 4'-kinase [bacterium]
MAGDKNELEKWATDVIFGRARGFGPSMMRILLRGLSWLFRLGVRVRLRLFRKGWKTQSNLGTMVVSIGNITVGGTGKTPVVERFARELTTRGRKVAILSRGYKSKDLKNPQKWKNPETGKMVISPPKIVSDGKEILLKAKYAGDEPYMLAQNLPGVAVVVDRDRVRSGRFAVKELGADILLLDDGLQYLDLDHSLDVVLVDQNAPFGNGYILPRGTLREPPSNLCRADYIFLTKCDGRPLDDLIKRIRKYNKGAEIMQCTHGPKHLQGVFHDDVLPLDALKGKYIGAISGIAQPKSFDSLLKELGGKVLFHTTFSDHYAFSKKEIEPFMYRCVNRGVDMIVTTEKDAVRFPRPDEIDVPIYFLRIEVKILDGEEVWERCVERICQRVEREPEDWAEERLLKIGSA